MRSSNISRFFEPSLLRRLDLAYLAVLLPLLPLLKTPMFLFLLLIAGLLLFRKKATTGSLVLSTLAGAFALFLSLYGAFSFAGLSRLKLFVELLTYLLIIAVSLQRLTRTVNFYLLISPGLLLALSLFFFHSVAMLGYVVAEIFILIWLILWQRMQGSLRESLRMAATLFALSLPWVVLLFIFFPRISFEHASFGFRGEEIRRMGHDGTMYLDSNALLVPSERIVMEVGFQKEVPPAHRLYFRGSVLYVDKKTQWEPLPPQERKPGRAAYEEARDAVTYKVTLYPTQKRWLYLLDLPLETPKGAATDADFVTTSKAAINEPRHYEGLSALTYRYGAHTEPAILEAALRVDAAADPKSRAAARSIASAFADDARRADAIVTFFKDANLTYTLRPGPLDLNRTADSFLFEARRGYCVHFAAAFVTFARLAGIPARVVTGYRADPVNSVRNYLAVQERDAHAWAELFIGKAWQRFEPTATAAQVEDEVQTQQAGAEGSAEESGFARLNLYLLYAKYQIETWILDYSHFRQMQLLELARKHPEFVWQFSGALLLLLLGSFAAFRYFRRPACTDRLLCRLQPLLTRLQKMGYVRRDGETLHRFFERFLADYPDAEALRTASRLYTQMRYGGDRSPASEAAFKQALDAFRRYRAPTPPPIR